ncbi:MAG: hypothetical protein IIB28_03370 [Chloroflexi bacterium]|nr:hypothetical protein [Chloroflexota bacterium]
MSDLSVMGSNLIQTRMDDKGRQVEETSKNLNIIDDRIKILKQEINLKMNEKEGLSSDLRMGGRGLDLLKREHRKMENYYFAATRRESGR